MSLEYKGAVDGHCARLRHQGGFSLVSAIFLLVVLATLGAFMVTFSTLQQTGSTQDLQGAKAYQAARAGIDWGTYQILRNNGAAYAAGCRAGGTPPPTILPLGGALVGFSVSVTCSASQYQEGPSTVWLYQVTSSATAGVAGQTNYVARQLQATIGQ